MGGRGGGGAASRERMQADFDALMRQQSTMGVEQEIQRAYNQVIANGITRFGGPYVYLDDLREELARRGISDRTRVDQALENLAQNHHITLLRLDPSEVSASPITLSSEKYRRVRAASVFSGGQDKMKMIFHDRLRG